MNPNEVHNTYIGTLIMVRGCYAIITGVHDEYNRLYDLLYQGIQPDYTGNTISIDYIPRYTVYFEK